jgi:hypothetical protein
MKNFFRGIAFAITALDLGGWRYLRTANALDSGLLSRVYPYGHGACHRPSSRRDADW